MRIPPLRRSRSRLQPWRPTLARHATVTVACAGLLASLSSGGCAPDARDSVASATRVDTVLRIDTVVRVDTVYQDASTLAASMDPGLSLPAPTVSDSVSPAVTPNDLTYLRRRFLLIPVPGVRASQLTNTYDEARSAGARRHDAIDILAPRGTPVLSVDAGRIAAIDTSERGGLSLYASDPSGRFMYYYAHLDRYARDLRVGKPLARGDTLGTVGTTGNAPVNTPHLHFAITRLGDPRRWWSGTAINPYPLLTGGQ